MAVGPYVGTITTKIFKLVLNVIIIIIYRTGNHGMFLGVSGTWNLNEEKIQDAEILASGVFVGYLVFNSMVLISYCLTKERTGVDVLMNMIGIFLWVAVAGTALHYWHGYLPEYKIRGTPSEKQAGLALGSLCAITGAIYIIDSIFAFKLYAVERNKGY